MANVVTQTFVPGFRLIDGTDLNTLAAQVNTAFGGSSSATTVNAGASGSAGTVNVFPATASKGNAAITASNNTGNTVTTLNFAAQAAARTYTVPDTGQATGSVQMTDNALLVQDIVRSSAAVTANATTTYADVTGLLVTVVPGTYRFICYLPSTVASGTGGIKYAFHYVTTVLTSIEATGVGMTASAVAVQHTTTATDVADLFSQAAVVIWTQITGTMVVATGGTIQLQMAQNTSNASNTITLVGASMEFDRIA